MPSGIREFAPSDRCSRQHVLKRLYRNRIAGFDRATFVRQDDEGVGQAHRAENAGALFAGRADLPQTLLGAMQDAALNLRAPGFLSDAFDAGRG